MAVGSGSYAYTGGFESYALTEKRVEVGLGSNAITQGGVEVRLGKG